MSQNRTKGFSLPRPMCLTLYYLPNAMILPKDFPHDPRYYHTTMKFSSSAESSCWLCTLCASGGHRKRCLVRHVGIELYFVRRCPRGLSKFTRLGVFSGIRRGVSFVLITWLARDYLCSFVRREKCCHLVFRYFSCE